MAVGPVKLNPSVSRSRIQFVPIHHIAMASPRAIAPRNESVQIALLMACLQIKSHRSWRVAAITRLTASKMGIDQSR